MFVSYYNDIKNNNMSIYGADENFRGNLRHA